MGRKLRHDMGQLVDDLLNDIPAAFQTDEYRRRAQEVTDEFKAREEQAAAELGKKAAKHGITLLHTPTGYTLAPEKDGSILGSEEFDRLSEDEQQEIETHIEEIKEELKATMGQLPLWQREMRKRFKELEREITELTVSQLIGELEQAYQSIPEILAYLGSVKQDVIENVDQFRQPEAGEGKKHSHKDPEFSRYRINVLVDNAETQGAPIIYEDSPTYQNLIGRVEHIARMGTLLTDFTLIKPGALHRANGGYLVLDTERLLTTPFAYEGLKRVLRAKEIRIESLERLLSLVSTISLEPRPIPIDLKVVLIGSRLVYYLLKHYDPEFGQLFKVAADFAEDLPREEHNDLLYAQMIATLQQREELHEITRDGVGRIIEESARRAGNGEKLSLHMGGLIDLLKEADYWATQAGSGQVRKEDVEAAIDAQVKRVDQMRERLHEEILRGTLLITTKGSQLAQINALSVIQLNDHAFGVPARISATARMGTGEVIDIEREVEQAGTIHSKGVLILSSYLANRYAKHQPLSLAASLVFEQTYGFIEGDSASAAELCALLSALGDIPIKQSLGITGSINQHGEIQAIGGVCEKIEGFFDICNARGLSGQEGVIIPVANIRDLMLRDRVIEAVKAGKFHVYAVSHVEQAMELLTGLSPGTPDKDGIYPPESINGLIQIRLAEWTSLRLQYAAQQQSGEGLN
jgi:lon-related putative ATP-dependent protease